MEDERHRWADKGRPGHIGLVTAVVVSCEGIVLSSSLSSELGWYIRRDNRLTIESGLSFCCCLLFFMFAEVLDVLGMCEFVFGGVFVVVPVMCQP